PGHRAQPELGVARRTDLARDHHVERRAQRVRHDRGDLDPSSWDAQDDDVATSEVREPLGEATARLLTIPERRAVVVEVTEHLGLPRRYPVRPPRTPLDPPRA